MVDELRKVFHGGWQSEGIFVVAVEVSEPHCEFQQNAVDPLFHLYCILNLSLFGSHTGQHHHPSLLVKSLPNLYDLVLSQVLKADGGHPRSDGVVRPFVGEDRLDVASLNEGQGTLYLF